MLQKETETAALLQECDAGIKMGIASIAEVLDQVKSQELYRFLADCKREHEYLGRELEVVLQWPAQKLERKKLCMSMLQKV